MKFSRKVAVDKPITLIELLAGETTLSRTVLKDCLAKGCVWLERRGSKERRLRRARFALHPGDLVALYYDQTILAQPVPEPQCLAQEKWFSIWCKPPMMLSQGTRFGDHCSLLRWAERALPATQPPFLVHRLDREASGLVLLAHGPKSAAAFSRLFQGHDIAKRYEAIVEGIVGAVGEQGTIILPLDSKPAETRYTVTAVDSTSARSLLDIDLITGRYHQIRRHLANLGHPLVGDRRYGEKKTQEPLQLAACRLAFRCPMTGTMRIYTLPKSGQLILSL